MPHKASLDGLRFLAFLAVFVYHARPAVCPWGWAGVNLFFGLSGFLITRILIRGESGRIGTDLRRYYIRRTLRIFPLYYAILIVVGRTGPLGDLPWLATYTYNIKAFLTTSLNDQFGHFWSLCVEEQFLSSLSPSDPPDAAEVSGRADPGLIAGSKLFQNRAIASGSMPWARFLLPYCGEDLLWGCLAGMVELRTRPGEHEGTIAFLVGLAVIVLGVEPSRTSVWPARAIRGADGKLDPGHRFSPRSSSAPGDRPARSSSVRSRSLPWPIWDGSVTGSTLFTSRSCMATGSTRSRMAS